MELKGHLLYYPEGKHDINLNNYVQKNQLNDALKSKVDSITETTYADLKNLRDNSQLIPGSLYRITNYNNTTDVTFDGLTSHQFDIILLALTPNTLAEEGWAAMHNNIYDVTFVDGITKKCWIYILNDTDCNIVDVDTLLGIDTEDLRYVSIDEINKTAIDSASDSGLLDTPDLTYNYFQNYNLSAWKVWYSLDNDAARFAWADDSVDEDMPASIVISSNGETISGIRDNANDVDIEGTTYYAWVNGLDDAYTLTETPNNESHLFGYINNEMIDVTEVSGYNLVVVSYTPPHEGTGLPNSCGVIYRITDESGELCKLQWNELKTIRDSKALVADTKYRIVDYQCTTVQDNTRSAGHQFDIVLLALSENKLAEEGWALMNESNVYDVTFDDGVTKKCYLYNNDGGGYWITDKETLLAIDEQVPEGGDLIIDESNKTATSTYYSSDLSNQGTAIYNYFQNSNLAAWKVQYCLDNDKDRFTWASSGGKIQDEYYTYTRDESLDENNYFAWVTTGEPGPVFTQSEKPNIDDMIYGSDFTQLRPILAVENEGKGVIYRLIDEFNNDVGYDFKNIQYVRPVTDGEYDPDNGEDTWVYTFSYNYGGNVIDGSERDPNGDMWYRHNKIRIGLDLYSVVFFNGVNDSFININCANLTIIGNGSSVTCYDCFDTDIQLNDNDSAIYINNKKVLTEE